VKVLKGDFLFFKPSFFHARLPRRVVAPVRILRLPRVPCYEGGRSDCRRTFFSGRASSSVCFHVFGHLCLPFPCLLFRHCTVFWSGTLPSPLPHLCSFLLVFWRELIFAVFFPLCFYYGWGASFFLFLTAPVDLFFIKDV